ncbi:hypothetical protein RISK_004034 [Rhodopirellula islandica]|uniref:Uncharacterized protein n=1 Tax=Rhodopirellula islandica TaxID=595434 RepID=A0A0J1BA90_RHOIS|nr:hypothetical protein RISK_004034 [Rhodopirellula islandica]
MLAKDFSRGTSPITGRRREILNCQKRDFAAPVHRNGYPFSGRSGCGSTDRR